MFRAIFRVFRGIAYLFIGRLDGFADAIQQNPAAIEGTYESIIAKKKESLTTYTSSVANLMSQREQKLSRLKTLTAEVERLERLKTGAAGKAQEVVAKLKASGLDLKKIKADPEYQKCQMSFADFSSTLAEKQNTIKELESSATENDKSISQHKLKLTNLKREIEKLATEKSETVADVIGSAQEKEINKALAGISDDGTTRDLEKMRNMRAKAKAEAQITGELAGTDHKQQEQEFEAYSVNAAANSEFESLIGLEVPDDQKIANMEAELSKIPEAATN